MNELERKREEALKQGQEQQAQLLRQQEQTTPQQSQQEQTTPQQEQNKQEHKQDFNRYGNQGLSGAEVEIRYKETMDRLDKETESPAMKQFQEKMQGLQNKVDERLKAQEQGKGHER